MSLPVGRTRHRGVLARCVGGGHRAPGAAGPAGWGVRPTGDDFRSPVTTYFPSPADTTRHRWTEVVTVARRLGASVQSIVCQESPAPLGDEFGRRVTTSGHQWRPASRHRPTQLVTGRPNPSPRRVDQRTGAVRRLPGGARPAGDDSSQRCASRWWLQVTGDDQPKSSPQCVDSAMPGPAGPAGDDFGRRVTTSGHQWRPVSRHRPAQLVTGRPNSSPRCIDFRYWPRRWPNPPAG